MSRIFYERLDILGFKSYRDYLKSYHWKKIKEKYRQSELPQYCLGCKSKIFQLHHRSYVRLGNELMGDLLPLCGTCHEKVHLYGKAFGVDLWAAHKALRKLFGWSRKQTRKIIAPFSSGHKQNLASEHCVISKALSSLVLQRIFSYVQHK